MTSTIEATQEARTPAGGRGNLVFVVWQSLGYRLRLGLAGGVIAAGVAAQLVLFGSSAPSVALLWGVSFLFLAAGNSLLLARGCTNRLKDVAFDAGADWEPVTQESFYELEQLDQRIRRWDRSSLDVTNGVGAVLFLAIAAALGALVITGIDGNRPELTVLGLDGAILFLPHWISGVRTVQRTPGVLMKIGVIRAAVRSLRQGLAEHAVEYYLQFRQGKDVKLPKDAKFKVGIRGADPEFLGLYGQVVLNDVQGTKYPYFYTVIVARQGYGLKRRVKEAGVTPGECVEYKKQTDVEVMVIRQKTTKKTGYHTKPDAVRRIFAAGLRVAEAVAGA